MINFRKKQSGFTLIEMIVSLGVFAVVVTTAVGALLAIISANKQLQTEQSIMTNLAFAMDTMTREIRTGYAYVCGDVNSQSAEVLGSGTKMFLTSGAGYTDHDNMDDTVTNDCVSSSNTYRGVSFIEGGDSITAGGNRILYYYDDSSSQLMRRVGNATPQTIVPANLEIVDARFYVTGSEPQTLPSSPPTDMKQPTVTIYLKAKDANDPFSNAKEYSLQTTVTQRVLDL